MGSGTPLFPEAASTMASRVDNLYFFLLALAAFFSILIAGLIIYFAVKFHRRSPDQVGAHIHGGMALEIGWTLGPLLIVLVIFVWGASSGCGSSSTSTASARSTNCTCRSAARSS
jgi:cytochrome c oxidase subunit 2